MAMLATQDAVVRSKSPEAFRTISEVSSELDVPQHVLRFWETRFAQVKPVKRAGGRRYYRPEDVDLLRGIRSLLYSDGFTIKGVQKILRERGLRHVAELGRISCADGGARLNLADDIDRDPDSGVAVAAIEAEADDIPTHARAAIAALERAHAESTRVKKPADAFVSRMLAEEERVKLELLLAELLKLKSRIRTTRAKFA